MLTVYIRKQNKLYINDYDIRKKFLTLVIPILYYTFNNDIYYTFNNDM